ncbi:uncharacterized protein MONOS_17062 [Monocercomonoides exilis]|uniref:uncharacterized protein n=1 Tax=Monocercomonoides exilis TaxID=2049356 RepID=UPI003559422D|nr:hypothetical protein MONOS_17062 [Monocercomonoides exilis]
MPTNDLATNEELEKEGSSIDLEKEEKEKEEEKKKKDDLVMMTVMGQLVDLCDEQELIVMKPVVEVILQPDRTISITFIRERLFGRREKRRERYGGVYLTSDGAWLLKK